MGGGEKSGSGLSSSSLLLKLSPEVSDGEVWGDWESWECLG